MDFPAITDFYNGHVPEVLMIVAGIVALLIVYTYKKDDESGTYKFMMLIGFVLGLFVMSVALTRYSSWSMFDAVLVFLAGYTLFIRPLTKVNFAILIALLVMAVVYINLGALTGDLAFLATGWPRIIASIVVGGLLYAILNFLETLVKLLGQFLNCWPILAIFAIICILEGALMLAGQPSLFNYFTR